ncbi:MAG: hypothetical protein QN168_10985 [Armatimonadota bacterium]|nr:hypothetical protein [Armatimonadota bacterium]
MAVNPLEVRMAHLEGAYEQISERLGSIEARLDHLDARLSSRIDGVESRLTGRIDQQIGGLGRELVSRMDRQFYWILTLVVIAILVPIFLRFMGE